MNTESTAPEEWWFDDEPCGRSKKPGLIQKKTFDRNIKTFVREVLQNSLDARIENDDPVRVSFELQQLDDDRDVFNNALCWDDLYRHVKAGGKAQDGHGIADYVEHLEDDGPFRVLTIEEENAKGIQGNEVDEDTDYAALVRDPGASNKRSGTGGRHGLGSTLLWVASGFQTVLFNSTLESELEDQTSPRLIGRSFIPTHQCEPEECYDNDGWFGSPTGLSREELKRPESMWGDTATQAASALNFERPDASGTSIMILGFRDPADPAMDDQPTPAEFKSQFESTTAEHFWPAICRGDLEVEIDMCGHQTTISEESIRQNPTVKPFIECYDQRFDAPTSCNGPGTFAKVNQPYEISSKKSESTPTDGEVTVVARKAEPSDTEGVPAKRMGQIAMFRGPGMVVKYKPGYQIGHSGKYHAILAAGEARTPVGETHGRTDKAIDDFLAMAEPPMHHKWYGSDNDELKSMYKKGCVGKADGLSTRVLRDALSNILYSQSPRGATLVRPNRDILPRTRSQHSKEPPGPGPSRKPLFNWEITADSITNNQWEFEGTIEPNYEDVTEWDVQFEIVGIFEDEQEADTIPIEDVDATSEDSSQSSSVTGSEDEEGGGEIIATADVGQVKFTIKSKELADIDPQLGNVSRTRFKITDGGLTVEDQE